MGGRVGASVRAKAGQAGDTGAGQAGQRSPLATKQRCPPSRSYAPLLRVMMSHFSGVTTMTWVSSISPLVSDISPVSSRTCAQGKAGQGWKQCLVRASLAPTKLGKPASQ